MNDILPADTPYWQFLEQTARDLLSSYGYQELRVPIVEKTELFSRAIGEVTDIVEKEMYTFADRNGDSLTLRPECTAGCVRAGIENGLLYNQIQRLWSMGPMFRYERPQKGRYRQFHQIDVEAFGIAEPTIDAELILMSARLWRQLGISRVSLHLNSIGSSEARAAYRERLVAYLESRRGELDEDSLRRLKSNPLRVLDSKNSAMQDVTEQAPKLLDHLDPESREHFDALKHILQTAGIDYVIDPKLVRGLDYYTRTVFEWVSEHAGAQNAVCGGGRYDGLVTQIGGQPTPGIGFAIGSERLISMIKERNAALPDSGLHAYLLAVGEEPGLAASPMAERLRDRLPALRLLVDGGTGGFKAKMKRADRSGARIALIIGEEEHRGSTVTLKDLRDAAPQTSLSENELGERLQALVIDEPRHTSNNES